MPLDEYRKKRDFAKTPEPAGDVVPRRGRARSFCVQKHAASHLHYDFRLELEGVLKSWAVPKGPSLDPDVRRLAMQTEDHPLAYGDFEGVIPEGQYGGGTVLLWDRGTWVPLDDDPHRAIRAGKLRFELRGARLRGAFVLVRGGDRSGRAWRLVKVDDEHARRGADVTEAHATSVATGRAVDEIARDRDRVWHSNRAGGNERGELEDEAPPSRVRKKGKAPPKRLRPSRVVEARAVPGAEGFVHEIAIDGQPAIARVSNGSATLVDAKGHDVSSRFPAVLRALRRLDADVVLEGAVAVLRPDGKTAPPEERDPNAALFAFDLLFLEGDDLRKQPHVERRRALDELIASSRKDPALRAVRWFEGRGGEVFDKGCALGATAIVSRKADAAWGDAAQVTPCGRSDRSGYKPNHLSKPDKLLWRDDGITKRDLAEYYVAIADAIVPHVRGRPLTLVRAAKAIEDGVAYMRHSKVWGPSALRRIPIQEKTKIGEYLVADDIEAVLGLVQMSIVEIHTWNSVDPEVERPDRLVLDLDPDERVPWSRVLDAARLVRDRLADVGLAAFVKTTGGKGLHVVAPLLPTADWDECFAFSRRFAEAIARDDPRAFTTTVVKERRRGKILLDYLRNNRGNTSVAAFSTRARPGAPVSMPVSWEELGRIDPTRFTLRTVPKILAKRRRDPWADYDDARRPLDSSVVIARASRKARSAS